MPLIGHSFRMNRARIRPESIQLARQEKILLGPFTARRSGSEISAGVCSLDRATLIRHGFFPSMDEEPAAQTGRERDINRSDLMLRANPWPWSRSGYDVVPAAQAYPSSRLRLPAPGQRIPTTQFSHVEWNRDQDTMKSRADLRPEAGLICSNRSVPNSAQ